jgi:hypothetical protein
MKPFLIDAKILDFLLPNVPKVIVFISRISFELQTIPLSIEELVTVISEMTILGNMSLNYIIFSTRSKESPYSMH